VKVNYAIKHFMFIFITDMSVARNWKGHTWLISPHSHFYPMWDSPQFFINKLQENYTNYTIEVYIASNPKP